MLHRVLSSSTSSLLAASKINLGSSDTDSATVTVATSSVDPTGTVAFYACGPTTSKTPCTPSGSPFDTETLNGIKQPVDRYLGLVHARRGGIWCFAAVYVG